jgi:hypothetical protein
VQKTPGNCLYDSQKNFPIYAQQRLWSTVRAETWIAWRWPCVFLRKRASMERWSTDEVTVMFLALGTLLASARILGEVAKRFNQPAVLGEIVAGIPLGPTVLGTVPRSGVVCSSPYRGKIP